MKIKNSPQFVQKRVLQNGIRVLIHKMPWTHSVTARLIVGAGPRYENEQTSGAAHFLEHMFFEGSKKYPSARTLAQAIKVRGGKHTAATLKEYVFYQVKVPAVRFDYALEHLRELVFNATLAEKDIAKERRIISSELRQSIDNPQKHRWDMISNHVWRGHPLGQSTLGTFGTIQKITRGDLLRYHHRLYRPDNMVLLVAGNVPSRKGFEVAQKYFRGIKRAIHEHLPRVSKPRFIRPPRGVATEKRQTEQTHVMLVFSTKGRGMTSSRVRAIQVLAEMLNNAVFYKFVYELGFSYSAWCWPWLVRNDGIIVLLAEVRQQNTEAAIETLISETNNLRISQEALLEAKAGVISNMFLHLADSDDFSRFIGEQEFFTGVVKTPDQIKREVDAVSLKELETLHGNLISRDNGVLLLLGDVSKNLSKRAEKYLRSVHQTNSKAK